MDGEHTIYESMLATEQILSKLFWSLNQNHVLLECCLLKPNMIRPGIHCKYPSSAEQMAELTVTTMQRCIPPAIKGIFFLSGGMVDTEATEVLNKINISKEKRPWYMTFSFGRGLLDSTFNSWKGKDENIIFAQKELLKRCKLNSLATMGRY